MTGAAEDEFLLKWHDHHQSFFLLVEELVMREQLTDVTLACGSGEDQQLLSAHSLMLSVCSPYFRTLLSENRHKEKHHIIHLHGVSARHLQQLLVYMYRGEISISQEDLAPLIETARCLQIQGLAMAQPNVNLVQSPTAKKRPISQVSPVSSGENSSPSQPVEVNVSPYDVGDVSHKNSIVKAQVEQAILTILSPPSGEAGWSCSVCGKSSKFKQNVMAHIETAHMEDHPGFTCPDCLKTLKSQEQLRKHKCKK